MSIVKIFDYIGKHFVRNSNVTEINAVGAGNAGYATATSSKIF